MATIRELVLKLRARGAGQASREVQKLADAENEVAKKTDKVSNAQKKRTAAVLEYARASVRSYKSIGNVAKMAAMGLGILVGVQGILVARAAIWAEQISRMAVGFSMTVGQAQEMTDAFLVLGGTTDDLADALGTMADRATDAVEGSSTYRKEFKRIGASMDEVKAKLKQGPLQLLELFVDKASKMKDRTQALTAAVRLFGDDLGRRLVPVLVEGGESFKQIILLARKFGMVLEESQIKRLKRLQLEFRKLQFFAQGLGRTLAADLAVPILGVADDLNKWIGGMDEITKNRMSEWATMLGETIDKLRLYWKRFYAMIGGDKTLDQMLHIFTQLTPVIMLLGAGFAAITGSGLVVTLLGKLTAAGAILAFVVSGLILAFEDLIGYFNGVPSVMAKLEARFPAVGRALDSVKFALYAAKIAIEVLVVQFKNLMVEMGIEGPDGLNTFEWILVKVVTTFLSFLKLVIWAITILASFAAGVMKVVQWFMKLKRIVDEVAYTIRTGLVEVLEDFADTTIGTGPVGAFFANTAAKFVGGTREDGTNPMDLFTGYMPGGNIRDAKRQREANAMRRKQFAAGALTSAANSGLGGTDRAQEMALAGTLGTAAQRAALGRGAGQAAALGMASPMSPNMVQIIVNGDVTDRNVVELGRKTQKALTTNQRAANAAQAGGAR